VVGWVCTEQLSVPRPRRAQETARLHYVSLLIPSAGEIRPTVIDKIQLVESIGSGLRDSNLRVVEAVDFNIQLLYTLNLCS
jgi:hypothetical protein